MHSEEKGANFIKGRFVRVVFLFCVLTTLLNLSVWFGAEHLKDFDRFIAYCVTALMRLSGLQVLRVDTVMYISNSTWKVTTECNAMYIMAIFSSFILAFPSSFKEKGIALSAGLPFIFAANIMRLYMMAWIDKLRPEYSEYFHNYMWQVVFIFMVVFMWIHWIDWIKGREDKTAVCR